MAARSHRRRERAAARERRAGLGARDGVSAAANRWSRPAVSAGGLASWRRGPAVVGRALRAHCVGWASRRGPKRDGIDPSADLLLASRAIQRFGVVPDD